MKRTCGQSGSTEIPNISGSLSNLPSPRRMDIYSPSVPIQGENSSAHPSHIGGGWFQRLQNVRFHNSDLYVRDGSLELAAAAPVAGAAFRGAFVGYLDGALRMFAAYRVSGAPSTTRVYEVNGITGTSYTFTEITQASGNPYDEMEATANVGTRFYDDGFVSFAIVSDGLGPTPTDLLIFSNGINAPRVYGSSRDLYSGLPSTKAATCGAVSRPANDTCFSTPDVTAYVDVRNTASTSVGAVTGTATLTKATIGGETYLQIVTGTAVGSVIVNFTGASAIQKHDGDYFVNSTTLPLNLGKQLILVVEDSKTDPIWRYCKITANPAGTPVVLWDPSSSNYVQPYYYALDANRYLVAFNLEESLIDQTTITAVSALKFEITAALPATRTLKVYGIMHGGQPPALSEFTVSYIDSKSRSESGGTVCIRKDAPNLGGLGGRGCALAGVPERLPIADGLYLRHAITYPHSPVSNRVDYAMLYRREFDESSYQFVAPMGIPRSAFFGNNSFYSDNAKSRTRYINRLAPTGGTVGIPYAAYLMSGNGRLYAGCVKGAQGEVWISGDRTPFRFSQVASVTGSGASKNPAYHRMQGEVVQGMVLLPGQTYGAAPTLVFTNKRTYRLEGIDALSLSRATIVSNIGCSVPRSIAEHNGQVYFVSSDKQVWRYGLGSDGMITYNVVDSRLRSSVMTASCAVAGLYGYQLAIQEGSDTSPKSVMRFDSVTERWNHDYLSSAGVVGMVAFDSGGDRRTVFFLSDGKVFWFEKPGQTLDGATPIRFKLVTPEIHGGLWPRMVFGTVGIMSDLPLTPPTLTITKSGKVKGNTSISEVKYGGATGPRLYREDMLQGTDSSDSAIEDVSCVVTIEGDVLGGTHFHNIGIDTEVFEEAPDVYRP